MYVLHLAPQARTAPKVLPSPPRPRWERQPAAWRGLTAAWAAAAATVGADPVRPDDVVPTSCGYSRQRDKAPLLIFPYVGVGLWCLV